MTGLSKQSAPDRVWTPAAKDLPAVSVETDPIKTEVIRQALIAAAREMRQALIRTAFSPLIYEVYDFACGIYDAQFRLLSQALGLPHFMGRLSFCVTLAIEAVGGEEALEPGDIVLYNFPYGTGAHAQDAAVVMPVFYEGRVVAYSAIKAHLLDIGGKDPFSTDTVDVFQEGTIFPGVKLCRRGRMVEDIFRIITANSRVPRLVSGDLQAEIVGVRAGATAVVELLDRFGQEDFWPCVHRMFAHGECVVRSYFQAIPDGLYATVGELDDNGIGHDPVPIELELTVHDSNVVIDFSHGPDAQDGPINCPLPATVAAARVAIMMLAGAGEAPNEGHFAPLTVVTRPGTLFHPRTPAPCSLYGWPLIHAIELVFRAVAEARSAGVPAGSGGCTCSLFWWGRREGTGEPWADGAPHPIGLGAHLGGDGGSALMHVSQTAARNASVEVFEARYPIRIEEADLATDSCGAGQYRGGLGIDIRFRALEDCWLTAVIERTKNAPWGLHGGKEGRPNSATLELPNGTSRTIGKATRVDIPKGAVLRLETGGGGGFGVARDRLTYVVEDDICNGYISERYASEHYPSAWREITARRGARGR